MEIKYEKATEKDAYAIRYIGAHSWKETYKGLVSDEYLNYKVEHFEDGIEKQKKILQNENNNFYIAKVDDKTVGFVSYGNYEDEKYKEYGHIGALYLLKDYQGYGIGRELFKIALEGLKELGYTKMELECMTGNSTVNFYKKYLGEIVDVIDYPLNGGFSVNADIMIFDIEKSLKIINSNQIRK
ncbi:MAG: GNAT family N-acetyltransferase [Firmicutes bacterium]|nr:GNAT family N-acetyltransferase [Bacillota bacterium]